ncbi:AraC family transcriptional regulator [Saccharibacillus sacchari]|uniref:AraC family transcriptional regulator n=1 Tax=Saccharibacillus sacchari TaxID=456493 RepID=A0ACC6PGP6_9BACL
MISSHKSQTTFTQEILTESIQHWTRASVSLLDIRHETLPAGHSAIEYCSPAGLFAFSYGGSADVSLGGQRYGIERFGLFHTSKGNSLSISPGESDIGLYKILYRAEAPTFRNKSFKNGSVGAPFRESYGFEPSDPLFFAEHLQHMRARWISGEPLDLLYGKTALHQLVYRVYEELERGDIRRLEPDPVSMAKHYLDTHYREPVSLRTVADSVHVSASSLSRLFRKQEGVSPQEYLIRKRISAAKELLQSTNATLREIASHCGFSDEFHLIKTFKGALRMTPGDYRKLRSTEMRDLSMSVPGSVPYARWNDLHSHTEGDYAMFAAPKGKMMLAVLGLTLLLSACSPSTTSTTGAAGSSGTASSENSLSSATAASTAPAETTREFQHTGGTTEVPTAPKRIVTDWFYGELLTLGIRPIAYPEYLLSEYPYVESEGTEGLGESMEQVIGLEPDLIISVWDESYQQFAKIAPSVLFKSDMPLAERMKTLGDLVGRQKEAQDWQVAFEAKVEEAKTNLQQKMAPDTSVTILSIFQKEVKVHGKRNTGAEVVYKTLGVPAPKAVEELFADTEDWNKTVSLEALPDLAGTDIILTTYDPEGTGQQRLKELKESEVWKDLDAVKNGRVHEVDYYDLFYEDPIAVENQIEMITNMLTE